MNRPNCADGINVVITKCSVHITWHAGGVGKTHLSTKSSDFDHVNHDTLIRKLHERNLPLCFIAVIKNWYDKLTSVVKWNSVFSMPFVVRSGVRQGGILSPILFNVYVNDLVNSLVDKDCVCHVGSVFFWIFHLC